MIGDLDLPAEIEIHDVVEWLSTNLPAWATRTRFDARLIERDGVVVLTAKDTSRAVGYAIFDKPMSHLHYIETREDSRRRGVASRLWARMREPFLARILTRCRQGLSTPANIGAADATSLQQGRLHLPRRRPVAGD